MTQKGGRWIMTSHQSNVVAKVKCCCCYTMLLNYMKKEHYRSVNNFMHTGCCKDYLTVQKLTVWAQVFALKIWHIPFNPILHADDSATKFFSKAALASKWGKFVILEKCPLNLYKKRFQSNDEIRSTILLSHRRACYHWAIRPLTSAKVLQVII